MKDKVPEIYKNKINKIKSSVQKNFYYHSNEEVLKKENLNLKKGISKTELIKKINDIFLRPDYVYQADVTIMYKNGNNIKKNIVGIKDNYIITIDNERIVLDDILDIK